ncbi:hypothetical protein [Streptomyces sp. NPDC001401]|uniref:hypothetical protein n=1 Tax=Streptomyces sp. NPDC001401 TaxID=3364570 RepID=UPI003699E8F2
MFVFLLVLIAVLLGFGFLHPIWWVAAASAVLVFGAVQYGRRGEGGGWDRGGGSDPGEHRDRRTHRARWRREVRRDSEHDK